MAEMARSVDRTLIRPFVGVMRDHDFRRQDLEAASIPIHSFPLRSFASPGIVPALNRLRRFLRTTQIGLVHAFDTPGNIFAAFGARWAGVPVVLTSQRAHRSLSPPGQLQLLRWTDRMAAGIVVNCAYIRRHLIEDEGVDAARIHLCYNGIDITAFRPDGPAARPRPADKLTVGVVCALRPEKNLPSLLSGFALARAERPELHLLVVGSGSELAALQQQAIDLHLGEGCTFVPAQKNAADWMRSIDIFVLPSRTEALSNSLMEAMACGCSVLASNVGGNPELVEEGRTGFLFESGQPAAIKEALLRLAADPALRDRLSGQATRLITKTFPLTASVRRMEEIYQMFLGPPA